MTVKQKKEAKNMTYDKSVLEALKEYAEKEDRSESYIANKILKEEYDIEVVYQKAGTVVPVLSDEMYLRPTARKDGTIALRGGSNRPISLRMQFGKHRFESAVVLIKRQKLAQTPG